MSLDYLDYAKGLGWGLVPGVWDIEMNGNLPSHRDPATRRDAQKAIGEHRSDMQPGSDIERGYRQ